MAEIAAKPHQVSLRMIWVPALISLGVTLLRLTGELRHWAPEWFSPETGGTDPTGISWIVGITWLAVPFGIYFALRLARAGQGPRSFGRFALFAILGLLLIFSSRFLFAIFPGHFPVILIPLWLLWGASAFLQYFSWPALFRTLLVYGLLARIPVAVIMLLAMLGNWGTHYDYVGMPPQFSMPIVPRYLWLAFFPQLFAWVAFTITAGTLAGGVATLLLRQNRAPAPVSS
jgi:hypothetical protein